MFRYYQTSETSKWSIVSDGEKVIDTVLSKGGKKLTILAVSQEITEDVDVKEVKYKGPFYADIDMKGDLPEAARSCKALVDKLIDKGVDKDIIEIYASGSKGFHVILDAKSFSSGRALKSLPNVYKEMALALYVRGMDLQVYCGGKGNSWRIENVQRSDGNYRVRIHYDELDPIISDKSKYKELVKAPRIFKSKDIKVEKGTELEALFNACKSQAGRIQSVTSVVESEDLKKHFSSELPNCVVDLREGKVKSSTNFNQIALNMAAFVARSGRDMQDMQAMSLRMAENTSSSAYDTVRKRQDHAEGVYKYVASSNKYSFSCSSMRSCVSGDPCEGCELKKEVKEEALSEDNLGIKVSEGCYYKVAKTGGASLIATFILTPKYKVTGPNEEDETLMELKGVVCGVMTSNGTMVERLFTENSWKSKSNFLGAIEGIEGAVFFGSDVDIQKIKFFVFNVQNDMEEVIETVRAGIHIEDFNGFPLPTYVEPGMSLNKFGTQGTHIIKREIPLPPKMRDILIGDEQIKEACEALELVTEINKPQVVGMILGWFSAAHLKSHITHYKKEFPLLHLWGNAGSGKTRTAEMFMWLTGCANDYSPMSLNLPHSTKFPIVNYVTSTTTIPRILEEFNLVRLSKRSYNDIHEILKTAYGNGTVSRGTIGSAVSTGSLVNAKTVEMVVGSPILFISEQSIDSPPLRQRCLSIPLDSKGRKAGTESWLKLQKKCKRLEVIGKLLCLEAIKTTVDEVRSRHEAVNIEDSNLEDRPKHCLEIAKLGYNFLVDVLQKVGAPESTINKLEALREDVEDNIDAVISEVRESTATTEVDLVMADIGMLACLQSSGTITEGLVKGVHYLVKGDQLFLDVPVAHSLYTRRHGVNAVIGSYSQMIKLLRNESYCVSDSAVCPEMGINRTVVELSLKVMSERGIEVSLFD